MRAKAFSWEADGTGDEIKPKWVANKVAADSIKIMGKARYMAGETFYASIGADCLDVIIPSDNSDNNLDGYKWGVRGASWGDAPSADFDVEFGDDGFATFRYKTSDYVASDLDGMTLNLRNADGESKVCCTFYDPDAA